MKHWWGEKLITMKPDVYRVKDIGNGFLAAMAKPVPGEFIKEEFAGIANEGINQIVSLLEKHEEYSVGLSEEEALTIENGMRFVSYPIADMNLPRSVSSYSRFTYEIFQQISNGINTVVHCRAGIGRTGMITAGILLHEGMAPEEAFELISEKRGITVPDTEEQRNWVTSNCKEILNAALE